MNANKLKAKIIERGLSVTEFANMLNIDRSSMYRKLSNPQRIPIGDVISIKEALKLTNDEACEIFFN